MKKVLGILGGGQLGRMTAQAASEMGIKTIIYSDAEDCCAAKKADKTIVADYQDKNALKKFANQCDVITFEFENIPVSSVEYLEDISNIHPSSKILKITQNRIFEKEFVNKIGIGTTEFKKINNVEDLKYGFTQFGRSILKTATLGYDGKGQFAIKNQEDVDKTAIIIASENLTEKGLVLEKFCPFTSEASVVIARSKSGEISCYDPLTNIHEDGILDKSIYPAQIDRKSKDAAYSYASKIVTEMDLVGLLAIEFFVLEDGSLIVNEMAPRPHNSGHFSMD